MIVGISGLSGAGKDTVADRLAEKHSFVKVAMADPLKRICRDVYAFTDEQLWGPSEMRNAPDKRYLTPCPVCGGKPTQYEEAHNQECTGPGFRYLTPRLALQLLGTEWGRHCYDNTWVDLAIRTASRLLDPTGKDQPIYTAQTGLFFESREGAWDPHKVCTGIVIPDIRFKNEVAAIKAAGGKLVRIVRPSAGLSQEAGRHQSETEQAEIPDSEFDDIIFNIGDLNLLYRLVDRTMDVLKGRILPYDETQADVPPFLRYVRSKQ